LRPSNTRPRPRSPRQPRRSRSGGSCRTASRNSEAGSVPGRTRTLVGTLSQPSSGTSQSGRCPRADTCKIVTRPWRAEATAQANASSGPNWPSAPTAATMWYRLSSLCSSVLASGARDPGGPRARPCAVPGLLRRYAFGCQCLLLSWPQEAPSQPTRKSSRRQPASQRRWHRPPLYGRRIPGPR